QASGHAVFTADVKGVVEAVHITVTNVEIEIVGDCNAGASAQVVHEAVSASGLPLIAETGQNVRLDDTSVIAGNNVGRQEVGGCRTRLEVNERAVVGGFNSDVVGECRTSNYTNRVNRSVGAIRYD